MDIPSPDDVTAPYKLEYDTEWLAILSLTEPLMKYSQGHWATPSPLTHQRSYITALFTVYFMPLKLSRLFSLCNCHQLLRLFLSLSLSLPLPLSLPCCRWQFSPTPEELDDVAQRFGDLTVAENFVATVTPYSEGAPINNRAGRSLLIVALNQLRLRYYHLFSVAHATVAPPRENRQTTEFCQRLGITNPFRPPQPSDESSEAIDSKNPDEINLNSSDSDGEEREGDAKTDESATLAGRTEEGVIWSVEKRPGLHLPQPTRSHDDHVITQTDTEGEQCLDTTPVDSTDTQESSDQFESDRSQEKSGEQQGQSGGVVIRRRNQAMYDEPSDDTTQ